MDNQQNSDTDQLLGDSVGKRTELFHKYVYPHRNLIYKLCIKYTYVSTDVEDNYNEVLVNFFKYIETYNPERSIQTWLHIVTKRFVHDMNQRKASFKRNEDFDVTDLAATYLEPDHVSSNCMGMDNYHELYGDDILNALAMLKPIYREALLLQQAGYKLEEIMEISHRNGNLKNCNIETVKSRLFLAKQQMRTLINHDGEAIDK